MTFMLSALIDPMNYQKSDIITDWNKQKQMENLVRLLCVLGILLGILAALVTYNLNK